MIGLGGRRFEGNARQTASLPERMLPVAVALSAGLAVATILLFHWQDPRMSPDSWAYYELARSLRAGGYYLNHLRSFQSAPDALSMAFPPGYPALWAAVDAATGAAVRSGLLINLACVAVIGWQCEGIARRLTGLSFVGLGIATLLLGFPGFFDEVVSGRSIPAAIALVVIAFSLLTSRDPPGAGRAALAGVCVALTLLLRFDMLPFVLVVAAWFAFMMLFRRRRIADAALLGGIAAVLLPWMAVSIHLYGRPFASDNGWVALAADPGVFVTDWYPPGQAPRTAAQAPAMFFSKVLTNGLALPTAILRAPGPATVILVLITLAMLVRHLRARASAPMGEKEPGIDRARTMALVFTLGVIAVIPSYALTGYFDGRYFALLWLCLLGWTVVPSTRNAASRPLVTATLALACLASALGGFLESRVEAKGLAEQRATVPPFTSADRLAACLRALGPARDRAMVVNDTLAAQLAAENGVKTSMVPRNLREGRLDDAGKRAFLETYRIGLIVDDTTMTARDLVPEHWLAAAPAPCGPGTHAIAAVPPDF